MAVEKAPLLQHYKFAWEHQLEQLIVAKVLRI